MGGQSGSKDSEARRTVTMLGKPGCHLCDEARRVLVRLRPRLGFDLCEVNILDHPELRTRYQYAIPVLQVRGVSLLSGRIAEGDARTEIIRAFGPDPFAEVPRDEAEFLPSLQCPICEGGLESRPRAVACLRCGHEFKRRKGVLLLTASEERVSEKKVTDRLAKLIGFRLKEPES